MQRVRTVGRYQHHYKSVAGKVGHLEGSSVIAYCDRDVWVLITEPLRDILDYGLLDGIHAELAAAWQADSES